MSLLVGYGDGVVRWLIFQKKDHIDQYNTRKTKGVEQPCELVLKQAFKPHSKPVTFLAIDHCGEILATAVSSATLLCHLFYYYRISSVFLRNHPGAFSFFNKRENVFICIQIIL